MQDYYKKIRVLGKGLTALALKEKFPNAILYDDSDFVNYDLNSEEITVFSPGIPPNNNMVLNSRYLISDYDLFCEDMPFSIWITGTNGKTTTTQMMQHLLKEYGSCEGGNIGIPLSSMNSSSKIWILETSSFTLHYTNKAKPNIFILLPISEDHITWHGSFEEYKNAKLRPLKLMNESDIAIIPEEFSDIKTNAHLITYKNSQDLCNYFGISSDYIRFKEPFLLDALLAMSAEKILFDKINYEKINKFKIDKHKVEEFYDNRNRMWIDDSKATNVDATIKALVSYKEKRIYLILGGDDKGANLEPLFIYLKNFNLKIYSIGKNSSKIKELSEKFKIECLDVRFLNDAVNHIDKNLTVNDVAILSPAAASLDQFNSYAHRGEEFKKFVKNLS